MQSVVKVLMHPYTQLGLIGFNICNAYLFYDWTESMRSSKTPLVRMPRHYWTERQRQKAQADCGYCKDIKQPSSETPLG